MFKRILLKLSGESLAGESKQGINTERLNQYAEQVKNIAQRGVQIGIVIGGGNIFRGLSGAQRGFDRVKGDQMGMLATVINALALASALESIGQPVRVLTSIRMEPIGDFYSPAKAQRLLDKGIVVILAGGTRVDGIYTADPERDPTATKFTEITYDEVIARGLKVMDQTATVMCKENGMPIYVFNMDQVGNLEKVINGEQIGTLVKP